MSPDDLQGSGVVYCLGLVKSGDVNIIGRKFLFSLKMIFLFFKHDAATSSLYMTTSPDKSRIINRGRFKSSWPTST